VGLAVLNEIRGFSCTGKPARSEFERCSWISAASSHSSVPRSETAYNRQELTASVTAPNAIGMSSWFSPRKTCDDAGWLGTVWLSQSKEKEGHASHVGNLMSPYDVGEIGSLGALHYAAIGILGRYGRLDKTHGDIFSESARHPGTIVLADPHTSDSFPKRASALRRSENFILILIAFREPSGCGNSTWTSYCSMVAASFSKAMLKDEITEGDTVIFRYSDGNVAFWIRKPEKPAKPQSRR
jgi:hypothetical protein